MIKLQRYFTIIFRDPAISLDELLAFASDHLLRLIANNPGAAFNNLITALTTTLTALGNCSSSDIIKLGVRKGANQAKDAFREALPGNVKKIYGKVLGQYGEPSAQITQCFPLGRDIYNNCTDDKVDDHLTALTGALAPLIPVMGPNAHGDASGLLSTWIALYAACDTATGSKTTTEEDKEAARAALERQLSVNHLLVAAHFIGEEDKCSLFFQQHLLEDHPAGEEEEPEPPPPGP